MCSFEKRSSAVIATYVRDNPGCLDLDVFDDASQKGIDKFLALRTIYKLIRSGTFEARRLPDNTVRFIPIRQVTSHALEDH